MDIFVGALSHVPPGPLAQMRKCLGPLAWSWDLVGLDAGDTKAVDNW